MKRERFLDLLRIAAAMAVVVFHVTGSSVHNDPAVPAALADSLTRCKAMLGCPFPAKQEPFPLCCFCCAVFYAPSQNAPNC